MSNTTRFITEFLANPTVIGAVAPSSCSLARATVAGLGLDRSEAVLEYGPGTGILTEFILKEVSPATKFLAIEVNPRMAEAFKLKHPDSVLIQDSVENVRAICDKAGIDTVDCILSGLPWASFSQEMQRKFLDEMMRVLKPGGRFVTFAYVHGVVLPPGRRFARLMPEYFSSITRSPVVWRNLPPAFVYRCQR